MQMMKTANKREIGKRNPDGISRRICIKSELNEIGTVGVLRRKTKNWSGMPIVGRTGVDQ